MKRSILLIMGLLCLLFGEIKAQRTEADIAWDAMPTFDFKNYNELTPKGAKMYELYSRNYVNEGFIYFKKYPNSKYRNTWLGMLSFMFPNCWKNIDEGAETKVKTDGNYSAAIDWDLFNDFDTKRKLIRDGILKDDSVSISIKNGVRRAELSFIYHMGLNEAFRTNKTLYINKVKNALEFAISDLKTNDSFDFVREGSSGLEMALFNSYKFGWNNADVITFLNNYKSHKNNEIRAWVTKKLSVFKLKEKPFEFRYVTVDGQLVDFSKLQGKVVLIDFWSTSCSSCIKKMPMFKKIYDQYKAQDFVVLSAAYNSEADKGKVLTIHKKIGANWPLFILGGDAKPNFVNPNSIGQKIWDTYGFASVPQLLLFDKKGKLVMYNDLLLGDDATAIENLIKQQLDKVL